MNKLNPERALCRALNAPSTLLQELQNYAADHRREPLLVHLSTDQVDSAGPSSTYTWACYMAHHTE